jgi:glutamate/tyrosine decarboxylase-like PLP-dependent enzyme
MHERDALLTRAARHASDYLATVADRPVRADAGGDDLLRRLGGPVPETGDAPAAVIDRLADAGRLGTVATQGPRYFGFVVGGSYPVATAADWLVSAWDQNAGIYALSPVVSVVESVTAGWILDLIGLPRDWSAGFVTGCQMANFTALAAARHHVLRAAGWDVEARGLIGAPPVDVVVSDESHYTIFMALRLLGFGAERLRRVPTDAQGRMRADALAGALAGASGPCIVCAQAGNVNTGAFDPVADIAAAARARGAWLHVDGAFGLWAALSPSLAPLVDGIASADSIATDAHKWLNVPYDSGIVLTAHADAHRAAMTLGAAYIQSSGAERDPHEFVPEESRRARAVPVYAVLRSLGRQGLRELVERCCALARRMAAALHGRPGVRVLNDVVLNQVLVRFDAPDGGEADAFTRDVIARVQQDGTCWLGGTTWHGMAAMRISISNWSTTAADIDRSAAAILAAGRTTPRAGRA